MKNNVRILVSLIINLVIFAFLLTGTIIAFVVGDGILTATFPEIFKYFTFQSNVYMGIVAFIYSYYQYLILKGKKENIPHVLNVFYHVGVTAVALTFMVVILFWPLVMALIRCITMLIYSSMDYCRYLLWLITCSLIKNVTLGLKILHLQSSHLFYMELFTLLSLFLITLMAI